MTLEEQKVREKHESKKRREEWLKVFKKELLFSLLLASGFISAIFLIIILLGLSGQAGGATICWSIGIITFIIFIVLWAIRRADTAKTRKRKESMFKFFQFGIRLVIVLLLVIGLWGILEVFSQDGCGDCAIFQAVALGIVILWSVVFFSYFIWAVYFYNINYGYTEEEWDRIYEARENKKNGDLYSEDVLSQEPAINPYASETFGLPGGTVRGMIALTLLFGAIAMLVVSFGMKNELDASAMFWDQYEFFKTAFLMMIAFYFGDKSLQHLRKDTPKPSRPGDSDPPEPSGTPAPPPPAPVYQQNPMSVAQSAEPPVVPDEGPKPQKSGSAGDQKVSGKDVDPMSK